MRARPLEEFHVRMSFARWPLEPVVPLWRFLQWPRFLDVVQNRLHPFRNGQTATCSVFHDVFLLGRGPFCLACNVSLPRFAPARTNSRRPTGQPKTFTYGRHWRLGPHFGLHWKSMDGPAERPEARNGNTE
jgi:hypothetical protein